MSKYEIMFLLDADCSQQDAVKEVEPLLNLFKEEKDYEMTVSWSDQLAYPVQKKTSAHRYLVNFSTEDISKLEEFKRLSSLNNKILRHLIINVEKTYGYKNSINPKKILKAQKRAQKYEEFRSRRQSKTNERSPQRPYSQTI
ncbi:30S ribosomal protein S6 [Mycoplasma suis]|uniref:Small ribosomal subunit protein bS6 n=2 Tax=Mycoplasma suis TaxID=57372 RepID=F0QPZ8_MYCSL|nr:30S ribosomal protein S6 [Mycoplasma suis]ADX97568.1 30S ribosomal protein S6 [Mycoplasma suis str. Illinois]CBZ40112.1 30S ribosomal protein S6 [Mycoplasma suis KI3806]